MKTNKKGVSLIVLAVTIAVMIILATAVILSVKSGSVIEKANEAKNATDISNAKDIVSMAESEWIIKSKKIKSEEGVTTFKQYAEKKLREAGFVLTKNSEDKIETIDVAEDGTIYVYPTIPDGFVASDLASEDEPSEGLVIYEGLDKVSTDADAQTTRNQFVWVPVPNIADFVLKEGYANGALQTLVLDGSVLEPFIGATVNGITITESNDRTGEIAEYRAMKASVEKYGGFYIARYEAGKETIDGIETVVSKKDAPVYSGIAWGGSAISVKDTSAVGLARNMCNIDSVSSHLPYGAEWDAAIEFISKTEPEFVKDSSGKGNHTGIQLAAGQYATNNIYDIAGNVAEWTMEGCELDGQYFRVMRGGHDYKLSGTQLPASSRKETSASSTYYRNGFRVALYIK